MKRLMILFLFLVLFLSACSQNSVVTSKNSPEVKPQVDNQNNANSTNDTSKSYSLSEITSHNSANDCWMVIDAKVYNFTSYVDQHPDGPSILKGCGRDASRMFNAIFKHSKTQALLVNYYIGDLK